MNKIISIKDLHANIDNKEILKGVNLEIKPGEVHVIMGPNGSGKSTLSNVLMGHPSYTVTKGEVEFLGENLFDMTTDERARKGMFLSFQYPEEVEGISNEYFLKTAVFQKTGFMPAGVRFRKDLKKKMDMLNMDEKYLNRSLNVGFSGGEKKKNEILQMSLLNPKLMILDETDSGLDVDAIREVYETIQNTLNENNALLIITHYSRILKYIKPTYIHLFYNGQIVKSGDDSLADKIDQEGYSKLERGAYE